MTTKFHDRMAEYLIHQINVDAYLREWFPDLNGASNVMCPAHEDLQASLKIYPDGSAHCFAGQCGFHASNFIELYAQMNDLPYMQARDELYREHNNTLPSSLWRAHARNLPRMKDKGARPYEYLVKRGISWDTMQAYHLGYDFDTKRITIPVFDQFDQCVNIRLMGWTKDQRKTGNKYMNIKGHGKVRLYPEWVMQDEPVLVLVEGEIDALTGRTAGLPTVTWTGGSSSWGQEFGWMFAGKKVIILYDNDQAGREGARRQRDQLIGVGAVPYLHDPLMVEGKDLNDWICAGVDLDPLRNVILTLASQPSKKVEVCPTCGRAL
jgi:DNA primase